MALNIIFMGSPGFALPILEAIHISQHKIIEVYTQPPKKKNRGQIKTFTPVHNFCLKNNLEIKFPEKIDTDIEFSNFEKKKPDVVVVVAYGKILPTKILNLKNIIFLNIHASLLPKWRGAAPIQRAILNLDKETGISVMKIVPKLDTGPVMMQSKVSISKDENYDHISKKLSSLGAKLILDALTLIEKKKAKFTSQLDSQATYAKKINKIESKINWNEKANKIIAKINAFNPSPGSWFNYNGSRIKILKAKEILNHKETPGKIINEKFTIACLENAIQILEIQKEGKKKMDINEYLKGNDLKVGTDVD